MPHRVELTPAAQRDLRRLPREVQARLATPIQALAENPRPVGVRKLRGEERTWRIRVGPYRVVYDILDDQAAGTSPQGSPPHRSNVQAITFSGHNASKFTQ